MEMESICFMSLNDLFADFKYILVIITFILSLLHANTILNDNNSSFNKENASKHTE